jgi:anthranilate phosphoribosyltransferase
MHGHAFIGEIGRSRGGSRGLAYPAAVRMFEALFGGGLADVEVGAILMALRIKGESLDEIRAGLDVLEPLLRRVPVDAERPVVSIASNRGARRSANLVPLFACLLSAAGVQVVIHGVTGDPERTTTAEILQAMGLGATGAPDAAADALARGDPAFVSAATLSPRLAALLDLRRLLGVRNVGHTLANLLNPTDAPACLRIACAAAPGSGRLQHEYFEATGRPALLLPGTEGEAVAGVHGAERIDWVHDGASHTLVDADPGPAGDAPVLPDPLDAPATARWVQSVLAGERPVPEPIERQVGAALRAVGVHGRPLAAIAA